MITLDIPQTWAFVSHVRETISDYLPNRIDPEIREATIMAASELTENTIKFGYANPNDDSSGEPPLMNVELTDEMIRIVISSNASLGNLDSVKHIINELKIAENIEVLYLNRLQEIMENPSQSSSRLGLIRIVHEAKFALDYNIVGNRLKIIATRSLPG